MFLKNFFFSFLVTLSLGATAVHADPALEECSIAGPDAFFCSGKTFRQMKLDMGEGVTFWLHKTGFLSKVLVEDTNGKPVTRAQIENRIIAIVSNQAGHFGSAFSFSDLSSTTVGGVPFGTLSYELEGEETNHAVLHSYVSVKGRVLQVVSQLALAQASKEPAALAEAHAAALRAVRIESRTSDT